MALRYLFKTSGEYAAFTDGQNVFAPDCQWLGVIQNGNEVYRPDGTFLGFITDDDRMVRDRSQSRARIMQPPRPVRPLRPLRPLRRMRMPRLPAQYLDVLESDFAYHGPFAASNIDFETIEGGRIIAADETYLGIISRSRYDAESISNKYGTYGSKYNQLSILNKYGTYGSRYNLLSPFNPYSTTPPKIQVDQAVVAYLTANRYLQPRIDPEELLAWLDT